MESISVTGNVRVYRHFQKTQRTSSLQGGNEETRQRESEKERERERERERRSGYPATEDHTGVPADLSPVSTVFRTCTALGGF